MKSEFAEIKDDWEENASNNKINNNRLAKLFLAFLTLIVLVPLFYVVFILFKPWKSIIKWLGLADYIENYKNILIAPYFWQWFLNSGIIAFATLFLVLIFGSMAGYVVAKFSSRFIRLIAIIILGALMIPIHMVLMPIFILSRQLGIVNTHLSVIAPSVAFGIPLAMYIFRGFEYSRFFSSPIDSASEMGVFMRVMLPMTKPL